MLSRKQISFMKYPHNFQRYAFTTRDQTCAASHKVKSSQTHDFGFISYKKSQSQVFDFFIHKWMWSMMIWIIWCKWPPQILHLAMRIENDLAIWTKQLYTRANIIKLNVQMSCVGIIRLNLAIVGNLMLATMGPIIR